MSETRRGQEHSPDSANEIVELQREQMKQNFDEIAVKALFQLRRSLLGKDYRNLPNLRALPEPFEPNADISHDTLMKISSDFITEMRLQISAIIAEATRRLSLYDQKKQEYPIDANMALEEVLIEKAFDFLRDQKRIISNNRGTLGGWMKTIVEREKNIVEHD